MEILNLMLQLKEEELPKWYLGLLCNKAHLVELQWIFAMVWESSKTNVPMRERVRCDATYESSATWIFFWMKKRAIGEWATCDSLDQLEKQIKSRINVHSYAKLKWCSKFC